MCWSLPAPLVVHRWGADDKALIEGECGGMHGVAMLEVEEQAITALGVQFGVELHGAVDVVVGMDVGIGQIPGAHGDDESDCAQVWLEVSDHGAAYAHRESDLHFAALASL